ncbi:hypothetical protein [Micromonospora arida]
MTDDPATQAIRAFWQDHQAPTAERRLTSCGDAITGLLTDVLVGQGVSAAVIVEASDPASAR